MTSERETEHRILVVDDEEPILFAMEDFFAAEGYQVDCAREKEEAEALIATFSYSLMIADMRLSGVQGTQGLDLVAFVRDRCPATRIILLTAYGSPEIEEEARDLGADAFLHKPQSLPGLARIAAELLRAAEGGEPRAVETAG